MTNSIWGRLRSVLSQSNSEPIRIVWTSALRDGSRDAVAGSDIRGRVIHLHPRLRRDSKERDRILVHEIFHFVWVRLGNPKRAAWKSVIAAELRRGARGELGWSSEWRKGERPVRTNSYACEAFCDTAAWLYAGIESHEEFTLPKRWCDGRRAFFAALTREPLRY